MADSYSLDEPAKDVYDRLSGTRSGVVTMAENMAALTIPSVFRPQAYRTGDDLPGANSSAGADAVNNLASALMFTAFPPGRPMMRYKAIEHRIAAMAAQDPELWGKIAIALSRLEIAHRELMETTPLRTAYVGFLKQMLVAGNSLWVQLDIQEPAYHRMNTYVVKRSRTGQVLLIILKETSVLAELEPDVRQHVQQVREKLDPGKDLKSWEDTVDIYTVQRLEGSGSEDEHWCYWQEFEGEDIPGTGYEADFGDPPMYAAWLIPVYGSDWGDSYCEEYRGDLYLVDSLSSSSRDLAAAIALMLLFVDPAGTTSLKAVKEAENLAVMYGKGTDITALQLNKTGDAAWIMQMIDRAERRIARAFLSRQSIQRQAERVTAEEWKQMALDLDRAMGGIYSQIAQSVQRHIVQRFVRLHEEVEPDLPKPPEHLVRVAVVTGIDAMGATTEEDALITFATALKELFGPMAAQVIDLVDFARRLAAEKGINPDGLIKTAQRLQQEMQQQQQQQMQQAVVAKGVGPAVTALGQNVNAQAALAGPQQATPAQGG